MKKLFEFERIVSPKIIRIGKYHKPKNYSNSKESCAKKLFKFKRIVSQKVLRIRKNREPKYDSNSKES